MHMRTPLVRETDLNEELHLVPGEPSFLRSPWRLHRLGAISRRYVSPRNRLPGAAHHAYIAPLRRQRRFHPYHFKPGFLFGILDPNDVADLQRMIDVRKLCAFAAQTPCHGALKERLAIR